MIELEKKIIFITNSLINVTDILENSINILKFLFFFQELKINVKSLRSPKISIALLINKIFHQSKIDLN